MTPAPNWQKLRTGEMEWNLFRLREKVVRAVRSFFHSRGFMEIESPILTPYPTLDSNIRSIRVSIQGQSGKKYPLFLHTSPEYSMKKLLAAGSGNIFFIGKVFRDHELTSLHNPEFTLVEWYRLDADYRGIQQDMEDLVRFVAMEVLFKECLVFSGKEINLSAPWKRMMVRDLFQNEAGIDLNRCPDTESFSDAARSRGIFTGPNDDWETLFFRIFLDAIEPKLGFPSPVFLTDYPARMGLMARRKKDESDWVERTELYIAGLEMANGYTELTDPIEQRQRLEAEHRKKTEKGYSGYSMDEELIRALELGLPPCAGMALGLDRLIMLLADKNDIQDVLLFPLHSWMT